MTACLHFSEFDKTSALFGNNSGLRGIRSSNWGLWGQILWSRRISQVASAGQQLSSKLSNTKKTSLSTGHHQCIWGTFLGSTLFQMNLNTKAKLRCPIYVIKRISTPHSNKLRYISNFQAWSNLLFGCSSASIWIYLEIKQDVNASKGTWLRSLINLFPGKFELFSKICWGKRQNNIFGTLVHPFIRQNQHIFT